MSPVDEKDKFTLPYDPEKWQRRFEKGVESHDDKHRRIFEELVDIVGPNYVADDPGVCEAYCRDYLSGNLMTKGRAEFVVLPGSTEDIQQILKLANRLNFPFSIMSVGMTTSCFAAEGIPYWCQIDPKRMNRLEIDEKNMYAIVEPGVTHGGLQIEAMKVGLFNSMPSVGLQASPLAANVCYGIHKSMYRTGHGAKNILGMEWILPNGDILRTGSLATSGAGYFWGEGPGPDSRAIIRGLSTAAGSLGIVTRVAIKLFPWPGPRVWPIEGTAPNHVVKLPPERFKFYFYIYPNLEASVEAMREIAKVEIAGTVHRWSVWQMSNFVHKCREERWEKWLGGYWERIFGSKTANVITVGLYGWASEKQVKYEERVLQHIVEKTGGKPVPDEIYDTLVQRVGLDSIKSDGASRVHRTGHGWYLCDAEIQTLTDAMREIPAFQEIQDKYTPPLLDIGKPAWIAPMDLGHFAVLEIYGAHPERGEKAELELLPGALEDSARLMRDKILGLFVLLRAPANITGKAFYNVHLLTAKIKKTLDPNFVANPTRYINMEEMGATDTGAPDRITPHGGF